MLEILLLFSKLFELLVIYILIAVVCMSFCFLFSVFCFLSVHNFRFRRNVFVPGLDCNQIICFEIEIFLIGSSLLKPYLHCFVFTLPSLARALLCFFLFAFLLLYFCTSVLLFSLSSFRMFLCKNTN